jgi:CubicO group peptidase (beta-lactamase class C family)
MPEDVRYFRQKASAFSTQADLSAYGVAADVSQRHSEAINQYAKWQMLNGFAVSGGGTSAASGASLLAGLYESDPDGPPSAAYNDPFAVDRQWWVTLKRKLNGMDKKYPEPFVCPRPLAGAPAPVVREGSQKEAGMKSDAAEKIDDVCRRWTETCDSGFAACVVRHGVIVFHQAYGTINGKPMTLSTKTPVASVTKLFAGTLMGTFLDQGLVDLDAPVETYIPAIRGIEVETPVTVRHLYTHTADLEGHWGDRMHDMEEVFALHYPLLKIGAKHRYNGAGYALGSKIIETITGEALPQCFWNHLLEPLGMTNTDVIDSGSDATTAPLDLARLGQMHLNGGTYGDMRFSSMETLKTMVPQRLTKTLGPDTDQYWGVGFYPVQKQGLIKAERLSPSAFGHGGATGSGLWIDPESDLVIALVRHETGPEYKPFRDEFINTILDSME